MAEETKKISELDADTLKHLEARMNDVKKILAMHAEGLDAKTIASRVRVAESYTQHVIDVGDANKMMYEIIKQYGTPHIKAVIGKAKEKIAEIKAKEPAKVGTAYPGKKDKPATVIKAPKAEKPPKAEKKKSEGKPAKGTNSVMNSRNVAILEILKASKGMNKEDIGKAVNTKLGINRASWDTPMYELKKAGLVTFDAATKLYNVT